RLQDEVRPAVHHGGEGTQQGGDPRRLRAPPGERPNGGARHRSRRDREDRPLTPEGAAAMSLASEPLAGAGAWIKAMVDGWAGYSEDEETLTRVFLSPQHKACAQAVMSAMRAAGMTARIDAIGNVVGRYEAAGHENGGHEGGGPAARTLITGSHIDTVREAGAYD